MQLTALSLVLGVLAADGCLQCDSSIRRMHQNFVKSAPTEEQNLLRGISDTSFKRYIESSKKESREGIIGFTRLYRAKTEYQNEFERFRTQHRSGPGDAIQIMTAGQNILEKHLNTFTRDELCPNKCGLLKRIVLDCVSCRSKIYTCASRWPPSGRQECGEIPVQADEGEQAVLDCFLDWHQLLQGKTKYHFSWVPGEPGSKKPGEEAYRGLVVTDESAIVLNQLQVGEGGRYRCFLRGPDGTLFYQVNFLLTVTPEPYQSPRTLPTLPSLALAVDVDQSSPTAELLVPVVAAVTAVSLVVCVSLAVLLGAQMKMWKRPTEEEEPMETPSSESQTV